MVYTRNRTLVSKASYNIVAIFSSCLFSFINYCLLQSGVCLYVPLTILPIISFLSYRFKIPILILIPIGLFDDLMTNSRAGVFATTYCVIAYLISLNWQKDYKPLRLICVFLGIYIIMNIVCFVICG
jgi:hypothetical protein